ncbi:MAG: 50S ribosomal protein L1 [Candidatus Nanohaloarchaeota archaeon QJJ-5]|nr:50S ribosomal protein L1 [Candidatus Nanohaloarchaeota archaeon QJJ-5]
MELIDAVKKAKEDAKERNFTQSVDLVVNLKNVDTDNPDNRFSEDLTLPYRASEDVKVCVIGDTLIKEADNADKKLSSDDLEDYFDDKSAAKNLADEYDFFIAEAPLMPKIGQELGPVLGPRNKMPDPMPPGSDPTEDIEELRKTVSLSLKDQPTVKCKVGNEAMADDEIAENANAILNLIEDQMPRGHHNLDDVYLKLTMGPIVEAR